MTYNVFGGTLSLAQSISFVFLMQGVNFVTTDFHMYISDVF